MKSNNFIIPTEGIIPIRMTSDLLFKYLLQERNGVLKAILKAFLPFDNDQIISAEVTNAIQLGDHVDDKNMILDVRVEMNQNKIVNLEMQVINNYDWPERSLSYLCRCFDNLKSGQDYIDIKAAYHIGFLDYSPFPEQKEFYSTYMMLNTKSYQPYTGKFGISVIDLNQITIATNEDILAKRDLWARFFKATTWEEINMLASKDIDIMNAAVSTYKLTDEEKFRMQYEAREDAIRCQNDMRRHFEEIIANKNAEIEALRKQITSLSQ